MTLKDILKNIDKLLNESTSDCDNELISSLKKHTEIKKLIQNAAPYFNDQEQANIKLVEEHQITND